ncbi:MAG: hypothetical protein IJR52_02250 [Selenomonadaceae bacterium]|nr:hypothetical protein [Selenomonadaceae bacterium]
MNGIFFLSGHKKFLGGNLFGADKNLSDGLKKYSGGNLFGAGKNLS